MNTTEELRVLSVTTDTDAALNGATPHDNSGIAGQSSSSCCDFQRPTAH